MNRSIVYDIRTYTFEPANVTTMLAFDHADTSSSCPEAEHLLPTPTPATPTPSAARVP